MNSDFILPPTAVMTAMQTPAMRATMSAYSTSVAPRSSMSRAMKMVHRYWGSLSSGESICGLVGPTMTLALPGVTPRSEARYEPVNLMLSLQFFNVIVFEAKGDAYLHNCDCTLATRLFRLVT